MRRISLIIFASLFITVYSFALTHMKQRNELATFGGGCFWCVEAIFDRVEGVITVESGYSGGHVPNPTYKQVTTGNTGHAEVIQISFNPEVVSYKDLLEIFFKTHDPTTLNRQGADVGSQYRSVIFYHNEEQRQAAEKSKDAIAASGRYDGLIATEIIEYDKFYPAEEYHQDFYKKNPIRYKFYRNGSGRDQYLKKIWGTDVMEDRHPRD